MEATTQKTLIITSGAVIAIVAVIVVVYFILKENAAYASKNAIYSLIGYDPNVGANLLDSLMSQYRNKDVAANS